MTRLALFTLLLITSISSNAYDFELDGIYYYIDGTSVGVVNGDTQYQGVVVLPNEVSHNGKNYKVTAIMYGAFSDCSGLTNITIPNSVTSIGDKTFDGCSGITSITIPSSVSYIGNAFMNCSNLNTVISLIEYPFQIGYWVFYNIPSTSILQVPKGTKQLYQQTTGWSTHFSSIMEHEDNIPSGINVDATNFPDDAFRTWILGNINGAKDGVLTDNELAVVTQINCRRCNIKDLTGIGFFNNLEYLDCNNNLLTQIDVTQNTKLRSFLCSSNQLSSLNVTKNTELKSFDCCSNQLSSIDVTKNTSLNTLLCSDNKLAIIDVSQNTGLTSFDCSFNQLSSLDVTKNTSLKELHCTGNQLTQLNVSYNTDLTYFDCIDNLLTKLDLSKNLSLSQLQCQSNQLTQLDLSKNNTLTKLSCSDNQIMTIDLSYNNNLISGVIYISNQHLSKTAELLEDGVGVQIPNDFDLTRISSLMLNNSEITGKIVLQDGRKFLIIASNIVNKSDVDGRILTYEYDPQNNAVGKMGVTVNLSYSPPLIPLYTLFLTASGNGSASYSESTAKNNTQTFKLNEGTSATITFIPDNGYRIKSVKVNSTDVTSSVSNNQYTVNSIKANTTIEVEFEAIPIPTYTLTIKATDNGSVSYSGTTAKNNTQSFTLNEGTSATITFTPDNGYRIKSVKVNSADVTSSVSNNQYTVSNIKANTTVEVVFEAIPITTYSLTLTATGNGSASYSGTTAKNNTKTFTLNEGTTATITFSPDNGYRIKSVKVNSADVTSSVSNNQYTVSNIKSNTTVEVVFEAIPITTYSLTLTATGNGSASYSGTTAKNGSKSFILNEGTNATITFSPDNGYRIKSVKVNGTDMTSMVSNNQYTISSISANTTVEVEFEEISIPTYLLTIIATGNGSVSYNGTSARNNVKTFTLNKGVSAKILFNPDNGCRIKRATMNDKEIVDLSSMSFNIDIMDEDVTIAVEFEGDPIVISTHTLTLMATGPGYVSYDDIKVINNTRSIYLDEGTSAIIKFIPNEDCRIKSATMNGREIADLSSMSFSIDAMDEDVKIAVEFEEIPVVITTYSLTLSSVGNGSVSYNGTSVKNNTRSFSIKEGASAVVKFHPDEGYRIKSATMNGREIADLSSMSFTIDAMDEDVKIAVEFEVIPKYNLRLTAIGNGSVSYNGTSVKNNTRSFSIKEGASAVVKFHPDEGYRIKSATMNGREISNLSSMSFTIDAMDEDVTITVEFEVMSYVLTISSTGSGYVAYNDILVENNTQSYSIKRGESVLVSFHPRDGNRIKRVTVNGIKISDLSSMSYKIDAMDEDATIAVEFEAITYALTLIAKGPGYVSYNDILVENKTQYCSVVEGAAAVVTFLPHDGSRIKSAKMNGRDISDLSNMSFTIDVMNEDVTIAIEFEKIPLYTLTLSATGYGSVSYEGLFVVNSIQSFSIQEGLSAIVKFQPDEGSKIKSATMNGREIHDLTSMMFTINVMDEDVIIEVEFEEMDGWMKIDGISYEVESFSEHKVAVAAGNYGQTLDVPATITYKDEIWTVVGFKDGAIDKCENLTAVIWNPSAVFNARVTNPNLLLYVKDKSYASLGVKNVVINGTAESIELTDAANGNDFHCPRAFTAKKISYNHYYNMETGLGESKGWETIVLPFDVQKYTSPKGEIVPFTKWATARSAKPFWLFELTSSGYKEVEGIMANTPYIISMPNHKQYLSDFVITGIVTFSAENVEVKASDNLSSARYRDRIFVPNYTNQSNDDYYVLNVNNYYVTNNSTDTEGSKFIKGLRAVRPFEAYMTTTSNTRSIDVLDGMTTAIRNVMIIAEGTDIIKVYDTKGVLVKTCKVNDDLRKGLTAGVYIVNGKKMIIK